MKIGEKAGRAGALLFTRKVWAGILNIFVISYLARVLNKEDFGLVAIAGVFISIMDIFWQSIGEFLIYKKSKEGNRLVNSAFWLNVIVVLVIFSVLIISAPLLADFYHNEKIKYVIYILALGSLAGIFLNIPQAILKRDFDFKPIIIAQTVTGTLSQLSQLGLAIMGLGVYSLAIPSAIFPMIAGIYMMMKVKPQLKLKLEANYWKEIFGYTRYIIGNKVLGHLSGDGDSLIIGKVLGFTSLGVYNIANKISSFLNQNLMPIFEDIGFPIFTMYNHSNDIIRKQFMYATRLLSTILVPLYVLLILFAPVIIETLCGPKWVDAVLPLRILSVLSLVESVTYSTGMLYNALGKPGIKFYFTIAFTPVFLLLVWFFAIKGLVISCIVVTLLRVVNFLYHIYKTGSIINLSIPAFFKEIRHIAVPNILLTILYISVLLFLHNINTKYLMMIMYIPLIYVISYWLFKRETLKDYLLLCKIFPVVKMH